MKAKFTEEEVAALPDEMRERIKDNTFEGDAAEFVKVDGLVTTMKKEREDRKSAQKYLHTIRESLGIADDGDVMPVIQQMQEDRSRMKEVTRKSARAKLIEAASAAGFNAHVIADKLENSVHIDDEGQITVIGDDGEPLEREDGTLKNHIDVLNDWKDDPLFDGVRIGTRQSGSGSTPQKGSDGPAVLTEDTNSEAPPKTTRVSDMNTRERMLAATVGGGLQEYPR